MSITINSNIASLRAQRNLASASADLGRTFERLSSGQRIARVSDDPAGLAIAEALDADARIASQAIRNANDGISLISIADGALAEISNILGRMAELAEQSANGTLTNVQRSPLTAEFVALGSEIQRISATTEFNGLDLLTNSTDISIQVGLDNSSNSQITVGSVLGTLQSIGLGNGSTAQLNVTIEGVTSTVAQTNAQNALVAVQSAIDTVAIRRGTLGAGESRLNSAVNNLQIQRENLLAAESQIRDVDVAAEAAELVRLQIIQQAGSAVLAQANQQPALAVSLLS